MMKRRTALFGAGLAALPSLGWPLTAAVATNERAPIRLGQSAPVSGPLLYNVTALSGGRNADVDLYADVDATPSFDYVLGSASGGATC